MATLEQGVLAAGRAQFEAGLKWIELTNQSVQQLTEINWQAAKAAVTGELSNARQRTDAKAAAQWLTLSNSATQSTKHRVLTYAGEINGVLSTTRKAAAEVVEAQAAALGKQIVAGVETIAKTAPAEAQAAFGFARAIAQSFATALESTVVTARQAADAVEANFAALAKQAGKAA